MNEVIIWRTALVRDSSAPWPKTQVSAPEHVVEFFSTHFKDRCEEEFWIVLLAMDNSVIGLSRLSVGGLAASIVEPRAVFRTAVLANAAALICIHNHPSGNPEPSREDIRITRQLVEAGKMMGIPVHDHIIVLHDAYTSLAERGLMS